MRDDLPLPDTPVTQVRSPIGNLRCTSFKLFPLAPFNSNHFKVRGHTRLFLYLISLRPLMYWPVSDLGCLAIILGVPSATI